MINRESARTVSKKAPSSRRPTPRKSRDAATAPERVVFMNLAQCTNLSRAEQIGCGGEANVGRVRRDANLLDIGWHIESKCQNRPWKRFILF